MFPGQVIVPPTGPAWHFDGAALKPLNPGTGRKNLLVRWAPNRSTSTPAPSPSCGTCIPSYQPTPERDVPRRHRRSASLGQVIAATAVVNALGGVLTTAATRYDPPRDPTPVVETVTPDELVAIISAAIESAPDTPEGQRMTRELAYIAAGTTVVTGDWADDDPAPATTTTTSSPAATTTSSTSTSVPRVVTVDDWTPADREVP